jgi:Tfp pilus assembly major pilin PilA
VPWKKVKEVGWTKLKEIAKILTQDNVEDWVEKAKVVNTLTLQDMVKKEAASAEGADASQSAETEKVTTKTFKVHAGQKEVIEAAIKKAKETSGTDVDTMALEYICSDYLAGSASSSKTPAQQLAATVKGLDIEVVMHIIDEAFPDFDFMVEKKDGEEKAA